MNKKTIKSLASFAVLLAILATMLVPVFAQPGDASDPLVTRNYVTSRIAQVTAEINSVRAELTTLRNSITGGTLHTGEIALSDRDALFADVMIYFEAVYGDMLRAALAIASGTDPNPFISEVVPFEPLFIPAGRTLTAEAGVEFILRSGQATAISATDGMVDVTAGRDIGHGTAIPTNHLLLVPRSDGRGFFTNTDVWVMIKGRYEVSN